MQKVKPNMDLFPQQDVLGMPREEWENSLNSDPSEKIPLWSFIGGSSLFFAAIMLLGLGLNRTLGDPAPMDYGSYKDKAKLKVVFSPAPGFQALYSPEINTLQSPGWSSCLVGGREHPTLVP